MELVLIFDRYLLQFDELDGCRTVESVCVYMCVIVYSGKVLSLEIGFEYFGDS